MAALALFFAPIIGCCASVWAISATADVEIADPVHDCGEVSPDAGHGEGTDPHPQTNHSDCDDCYDASKAEKAIGDFVLPVPGWDPQPDTNLQSFDIAWRTEASDRRGSDLIRDLPPYVPRTLVQLSVLLLD